MRIPLQQSKCNAKKPAKKKRKIKRTSIEKTKIKTIDRRVNEIFGDVNLIQLAKDTGFLIRESIITPFMFIYALSVLMSGNTNSLNLLALNLNEIFLTDLTGSAFSFRMNCKKSVKFLKSCFESILKTQLSLAFKNEFGDIFGPLFKAVILEDSTIIELDECVEGLTGAGGASSKSSVKLNWVFNICHYAAVSVDIFSGSTPDRKNHKKSLKYIDIGMLLLRDLGYFCLESLRTIQDKGAYYLSRVYKGSYLYLGKDDQDPLDIGMFFKKITTGSKSACIPIYIGKIERLATFLVLQKVPKWVFNQRIKQYKKKNSGRSPSNDFLVWAGYSVFITNIPEELLKDAESSFKDLIIKLYKIRWQIELLFKKLKSTVKISHLKSKKKNRVLCLIYGKLISIVISLMILSFAASKDYEGREISLSKVMAWLMDNGRLAKAFLKGALSKLYDELCRQFKLLCKDKRNRKTTLGIFQDEFPWKKAAA